MEVSGEKFLIFNIRGRDLSGDILARQSRWQLHGTTRGVFLEGPATGGVVLKEAKHGRLLAVGGATK